MTTTWIPVTERMMTEEEREVFGNDFELILDGELPNHGQSVLVTGIWGVDQTVYYDDEYRLFEGYEAGEVFAWSPLPKPYVKGEA